MTGFSNPVSKLAFCVVLAISLVQAGSALAAGSTSATGNATPQTTSETFGNWTMRCSTTGPAAAANGQGAATVTHCEIAQSITAKGQKLPVAVVAVGPVDASGLMRLVVQLPVGVWLPTNPGFVVGSNAPVDLAYKRCLPRACLASVDLSNALRDMMKAETKGGKIAFAMNPGKDVSVPVSFAGFTAAFDALVKKSQ